MNEVDFGLESSLQLIFLHLFILGSFSGIFFHADFYFLPDVYSVSFWILSFAVNTEISSLGAFRHLPQSLLDEPDPCFIICLLVFDSSEMFFGV